MMLFRLWRLNRLYARWELARDFFGAAEHEDDVDYWEVQMIKLENKIRRLEGRA